MSAVSRDKDFAATGHSCTAICPIIALPGQVYVNGRRIAVPGSPLAPHTILEDLICVGHPAVVNQGSTTVFANGKPVTRKGDSADRGAMMTASSNVFAGSGGGGLLGAVAGAIAGNIGAGGAGNLTATEGSF